MEQERCVGAPSPSLPHGSPVPPGEQDATRLAITLYCDRRFSYAYANSPLTDAVAVRNGEKRRRVESWTVHRELPSVRMESRLGWGLVE
eukprot:COSAG01_NODE_1809_length_9182_cov_6.406914_2_plen_89_part_00